MVYHKGFVADRRNSEVNEFTRITERQPAGVQLQGNACDSTQNPLCKLKRLTISRVFLVYHKGFEPLAFWSVAKRSIQLS